MTAERVVRHGRDQCCDRASLADDRLVIRSLDNCSVISVVAADGALRLVEGGREADTLIR